jgi:hypothetical protein
MPRRLRRGLSTRQAAGLGRRLRGGGTARLHRRFACRLRRGLRGGYTGRLAGRLHARLN